MEQRPWSKTQLRKLGVSIRDGSPLPQNVPGFDEVIVWYNDLASHVQKRVAELDWTPLLEDRAPEITSRAKTIDTLTDKLRRQPNIGLGAIQDIAGVRFEAEMTLREQDSVADAIAQMFGHDPISPCLKDIRATPHSGYRAVHLWLNLEAPVEVQIRTHLQGEWANMYEAAGDLFGREIRYNDSPEDIETRTLVEGLQALSTEEIRYLEQDGQLIQDLKMEILEWTELPRFSFSLKTRRIRKAREAQRVQLAEMQDNYSLRETGIREGLDGLRLSLIDAYKGE